ncbi:MAG: hypothetical protein K5786_01700 [Treponema sp.]|nr:hypothetical protein [Treponema sp.]
MIKKVILVLAAFLFFTVTATAQENVTTITITHARRTTYKQDEATKNDMIELEGSVQISVQKGSTSSEIKADRVTYDRKTEMLYAEGNVEILTKSASAGGETTTADSLLMNTSTLEGVFDGGRVVQTKSDALNLPSGSTLIVFSDLFGKSENNIIAFKNSSLTFCDDEDPHWHIDATRTWLLPGGEFAFFNALLYVGKLPVLYLPAFYYPKDELIFNPVFGNRKREGYFVQTTTYLYGRKPLDTSSSSSSSSSSSTDTTSAEALKGLYNFMKPSSLKEQERQGLILHNLDEDFKGSTSNYVKLLADTYTNLGYMVGVDGVLQPSKTYLTSLKFYLNLGFSTTIFNNSGTYSPISSKGRTYWDKSNFLGVQLPFRYAGNVDLTLSKPFSMSLSLPLYSDPYFSYDFRDRQETMDWISYLISQSDKEDETTSSSTTVSSYTWKLSFSYSPVIPAFMKPYVSSLSTSLSSSVNISSTSNNLSDHENAANGDSWTSNTPQRYFYYPSQVTPGTLSMSLSGTLFEYSDSATKKSYTKPTYKVALTKPDELKTEKQLAKEKEELEKKLAAEEAKKAEEEAKAAAESGENQSEEKNQLVDATTSENAQSDVEEKKEPEIDYVKPVLPELTTTSASAATFSGLTYKLSYTASPAVTTQISYSTTEVQNGSTVTYLKTPEDFEWSKIKSFYYNVKSPVALNSNLSYGGSFISLANKVSWDPIWQGHPNTDGVSSSEEKSLKLADYKAESQTITGTNTLSFKPFSYVPMFSESSLSYNNTLKLFRHEFIGDADNPDYEDHWFWKYWTETEKEKQDDYITAHSITATFAMKELNSKFKQTFSYTATLPPQVQKHSFSLNLVFPYVTASFSTSVQETSVTDSTQYWNPFQQSLSFTMPDLKDHFYFGEGFWQKQGAAFLNSLGSLKLTESYNVNLKEWETRTEDADGVFSKIKAASDSYKLSLTWSKFTASYVMSYTTPYELDTEKGWIAQTDKDFLPYSFSLSYTPSFKTLYKWKNRVTLSPGLSTSITADLVRPTNSYFLFTPSLTFKINQFFDLSFSSSSRNSTMYWYFRDDGIYSDDYYGNNFLSRIFMDLLQSFGFYGSNGWGGEGNNFEKNRQASGFKLKTLSMTASHKLHDWSFNLTWKFEPKIVTEDGKKSYNYNPYITIGIVWNPLESIKTKIVDDYGEWSLE